MTNLVNYDTGDDAPCRVQWRVQIVGVCRCCLLLRCPYSVNYTLMQFAHISISYNETTFVTNFIEYMAI